MFCRIANFVRRRCDHRAQTQRHDPRWRNEAFPAERCPQSLEVSTGELKWRTVLVTALITSSHVPCVVPKEPGTSHRTAPGTPCGSRRGLSAAIISHLSSKDCTKGRLARLLRTVPVMVKVVTFIWLAKTRAAITGAASAAIPTTAIAPASASDPAPIATGA